MVFLVLAKKKITDALIESYDVFVKSENRGGGEAHATISEIITTLKQKFPIEDNNNVSKKKTNGKIFLFMMHISNKYFTIFLHPN